VTEPIRAGVIRNPRSQRNKAGPLREKSLPTGVRVEMPFTTEALAETLRMFAAEGVRHLMVDGGDGTLRDVLGALPAAYGKQWPTIALCASGNTNLAAADVGSFKRGPEAIARWYDTLSGKAPCRRSGRHAIEVRWPDGSRPPVFGFFVGCANYARGVQMATGTVKQKGFLHGWAVSATIAGAAWQVLTGASDSDWQQGSALALAINGGEAIEGNRFVLLSTSLHRLFGLGLWPFWSDAAAEGALHWLDIRAPAPQFGRALPAILRGKPKPWMLADGHYRSGRAMRLQLTMAEPLIIDGEPFGPDSNGQLDIHTGPEVQFHAPA